MSKKRDNNWGYPTAYSFDRAPSPALNAIPDQKVEPTPVGSTLSRKLFHLKIIVLAAVAVSALRLISASYNLDYIQQIQSELRNIFFSNSSIAHQVQPVLAAVPELRSAQQELWKCQEQYTNSPKNIENCTIINAEKRTDQSGNQFITAPWQAELQDEYYQ